MGGNLGGPVISPDGRTVAFVAAASAGGPSLWVRSLDRDDAHALPQTDGAYYPFWSTDSARLGFFADGQLQTVAVANGLPETIADGSGMPTRIVASLSSAIYAPPRASGFGHLLWVRDGDLLAQAFDVDAEALVGPTSTVASHVRVEESQRGVFASVSTTGVLVWADARAAATEFLLLDRDGRRLDRLAVTAGEINTPVLSPDGTQLLFMRAENGSADVWLYDMEARTARQITTGPDYDEGPVWSPDGTAMTHLGRVAGGRVVMLTALDGSEVPRPIARDAYSGGAWTPDDRYLVYPTLAPDSGVDIWVLPLANPDAAVAVDSNPGDDFPIGISPDGRWLAIASGGSGVPEIVLTRLVVDGDTARLGNQRIPIGTGNKVAWRRDGREIFTVSAEGQIISIPVSSAGHDHAGSPGAAVHPARRIDHERQLDGLG